MPSSRVRSITAGRRSGGNDIFRAGFLRHLHQGGRGHGARADQHALAHMRFDGVDRRSGLRVRRRVALVKGDLHQLDAASGERLGKMRDLFAVDRRVQW